MGEPKAYAAPHPCKKCGRMMKAANELHCDTYTQLCNDCATRPAYIEAIQLLDGVKVWSYPARSTADRWRIIKVGYDTCASCQGKGCDTCKDIHDRHPVRVWIAEREKRIKSATQAVYDKALEKEGILALAKKNLAPQNRLQRVTDPLVVRYDRICARWHALVVGRLKPIAPGRAS